MRRLVTRGLLILLILFAAEPVLANEVNYDSDGVTAFYGEYEYPKENTDNGTPKKDEEPDRTLFDDWTQKSGSVKTVDPSSMMPSYKEEGRIIPATGDTSHFLTSLIGLVLLAIVFLKVKEVKNAEKNSII